VEKPLINKKTIDKLSSSEACKAWPEMINFFESLASSMESTEAGIGQLALRFQSEGSLNKGEYVPMIFFVLVKSDSLIAGDDVEVSWKEAVHE